jgi:hypothetical protein
LRQIIEVFARPLKQSHASRGHCHLKANFDAVEFEPHVTVFSGSSTEPEARAVAQLIARKSRRSN